MKKKKDAICVTSCELKREAWSLLVQIQNVTKSKFFSFFPPERKWVIFEKLPKFCFFDVEHFLQVLEPGFKLFNVFCCLSL
jgi:hypothetical protein